MSTPGRPPLRARTVHGRAAEMAALERLLEGATTPAVAALVGEAGIGKTRLAEWAVARARERGRLVVQGTTHLGLAEPLGVFCDAVRGIRRMGVEPASDDPLASGFPGRVLPELGAHAGDPTTQGATFEAAVRYSHALAAESGLLLVLEDLHWADSSSLTLAALLARTLASESIALVVTYRPDDDVGAAALEGFRHELRRMRVPELALGPLAPDEAAAMLEELLGRRPEAGVGAELVRLSGGNPFALEELAQAVVDSGWIDPATGRRQSDAAVSVPWSLAESIRARSSRLAASERELIQWAAVIGEQFDIRLLRAAAGLAEEDVLPGLSGCVAAGLVVEDPSDPSGQRFMFRHALVHEAVAQERLVVERARRHVAVLDAAERLAGEGLDVPAAELARHAVAAGDRRRIVVHSRAAARQAYDVGAIEEAVGHLERALDAWDDDDGRPLRVELLLSCGRLRLRLSRGDERAAELLERAREGALEVHDRASAAVALSLLADARFELGRREQGLSDWDQSLAELREFGPADAIPQALAGKARGLGLQNELAGAQAAADEGLALLPAATDADQARTRVGLLTTRGMLADIAFRAAEARELLMEAARLAVEYQDDVGAARAHHILGANFDRKPPAECAAHFARAAELVRRHGLQGLEAWYTALQAWSMVMAGDWTAAERLAEEAEGLIVEGERAAWTGLAIRSARAERLLGLGELDESTVQTTRAMADAEAIESPYDVADLWMRRAGVAFLRGEAVNLDEGLGAYADALSRDDPRIVDMLEVPRWVVLIELLCAGGAPGPARTGAAALRRVYDSPWADHAQAVASSGDEPPEAVAARVEDACSALELNRPPPRARSYARGGEHGSRHPARRPARGGRAGPLGPRALRRARLGGLVPASGGAAARARRAVARPGRGRGPHAPRGRGARPPRRRPDQPRDRRASGHQRVDRDPPRRQHLFEARRPPPGRGGARRDPARAARYIGGPGADT